MVHGNERRCSRPLGLSPQTSHRPHPRSVTLRCREEEPGMSDAEQARFNAFMDSTDADERDWIAFCEFEEAIHSGVMTACMINMYDGDEEGVREMDNLKLSLGQMLFRVLPRVDLGTLIANVEARA